MLFYINVYRILYGGCVYHTQCPKVTLEQIRMKSARKKSNSNVERGSERERARKSNGEKAIETEMNRKSVGLCSKHTYTGYSHTLTHE